MNIIIEKVRQDTRPIVNINKNNNLITRLDFYRFVLEPATTTDISIGEAQKDHYVRVKFHREFYNSETLTETTEALQHCEIFLKDHYGAVIIYQGSDVYHKDNIQEFFQDMISKEHIILDDNLDY